MVIKGQVALWPFRVISGSPTVAPGCGSLTQTGLNILRFAFEASTSQLPLLTERF
jgi:hypothetical protein